MFDFEVNTYADKFQLPFMTHMEIRRPILVSNSEVPTNFFRSLNVKSESSAPGLPVDHSYTSTGSKSTSDDRFIDDKGVGSS